MKHKLSLNSCSVPGFFSPSYPKLYADAVWEERRKKKKRKKNYANIFLSTVAFTNGLLLLFCSCVQRDVK